MFGIVDFCRTVTEGHNFELTLSECLMNIGYEGHNCNLRDSISDFRLAEMSPVFMGLKTCQSIVISNTE